MEKVIKFKDQFLTFNHYKEPLKEVPKGKGYGYYGAVLCSIDGQKIQCHLCGELFESLGFHLQHAHKTTPTKYKEMFDLSRQTALVSEHTRNEMKMRTIRWWNSLSFEEQEAQKRKNKEKSKAWLLENKKRKQPTIRLETKNKRGTCPDQLIAKIQEVAKQLGHTPSKADFIEATGTQRFVHLIYSTFGSWTKAVKKAGLTEKIYTQNGGRRNYTKEELLEYLQIFYQEENKIPTHTDCRRGLIPTAEVYKQHFGSLPNARLLAGIEDQPTRWGTAHLA